MKKAEKAEKIEGNDQLTFAVIETGGKQYVVSSGTELKIERIDGVLEGSEISFDKVLLSAEGDSVEVGMPYLSGRKVIATVTKVGRHPKVEIVHYKQKSRYLKANGHRQPFLGVKIESIK